MEIGRALQMKSLGNAYALSVGGGIFLPIILWKLGLMGHISLEQGTNC